MSLVITPLTGMINYVFLLLGHLILILLIIVVQNLILNYRVLSLNNVLVNLEINIVHVTLFTITAVCVMMICTLYYHCYKL